MAKQYIKNEQKNQTRSTNCNRKTANDKKIINLLKAKQLYDCQHTTTLPTSLQLLHIKIFLYVFTN